MLHKKINKKNKDNPMKQSIKYTYDIIHKPSFTFKNWNT